MPQDPRTEKAEQVINAIRKRLDEAEERGNYDDTRVDLLAIIQYIQRNLSLIDQQFPPDPPQD